jgi:hypothetical protein
MDGKVQLFHQLLLPVSMHSSQLLTWLIHVVHVTMLSVSDIVWFIQSYNSPVGFQSSFWPIIAQNESHHQLVFLFSWWLTLSWVHLFTYDMLMSGDELGWLIHMESTYFGVKSGFLPNIIQDFIPCPHLPFENENSRFSVCQYLIIIHSAIYY